MRYKLILEDNEIVVVEERPDTEYWLYASSYEAMTKPMFGKIKTVYVFVSGDLYRVDNNQRNLVRSQMEWRRVMGKIACNLHKPPMRNYLCDDLG